MWLKNKLGKFQNSKQFMVSCSYLGLTWTYNTSFSLLGVTHSVANPRCPSRIYTFLNVIFSVWSLSFIFLIKSLLTKSCSLRMLTQLEYSSAKDLYFMLIIRYSLWWVTCGDPEVSIPSSCSLRFDPSL